MNNINLSAKRSRLACGLALHLFLWVTLPSLSAQEFEKEGSYRVFPVDTLGVVLLETQLRQHPSGDLLLRYTRLDKDLKEVWTNDIPFSKGLSLSFQQIDSEGITLVFASANGRYMELIRANTEYGDYTKSRYEFSGGFLLQELTSFYDRVWASGIINANPVVFHLRPDNTYETLPVGIPGQLSSIVGLHFNREEKALQYTLLGEIDRQTVVIYRAIGLDGRLLKNHSSTDFGDLYPESIKVAYDGLVSAYLVGAYGRSNRSGTQGFYWMTINEVPKSNFVKLKEVNAAISYKRMNKAGNSSFNELKEAKTSKANKVFALDRLERTVEGDYQFSFEVYGQEFRNRGTLEQQIIARDRAAQIDLNTYGRRAFDQTGPDMSERIEQMSATDQLQMRFMDQTLAKAIAQGVTYQHTGMIRFDSDMNILESYGLYFDLDDTGNFSRINNLNQGELVYSAGNRIVRFNTQHKKYKSFETADDSVLIPWSDEADLAITFGRSPAKLSIFIQKR